MAITVLSVLLVPCVSASADTQDGAAGTEGTIDIREDNIGISEPMSFDELIKSFAKNENVSIEEARCTLTGNMARNGLTISPFATYRTLTSTVNVDITYKPTLNFYCQTDEGGGSFRAIKKILNVGMNRSFNGRSKQFSGSVYTKLENPNRIYWVVNGDFYNNGTTTVGSGVDFGVGQSASIKFSISYASNFFKYCYQTGYRTF